MTEKKLKPVVYTTSYYKKGANNKIQQNLLLKAMQVTKDPKKLKEMIGVRTVAEVYRTLDKLSIRKEYHAALARQGVSLDFIIENFKDVVENAEKDADRVNALKALLKSVGMDKYEAIDDTGGGTWEETLLKAIENDKRTPEDMLSGGDEKYEIDDYEVVQPKVPDSVKELHDQEKELTKGIYD